MAAAAEYPQIVVTDTAADGTVYWWAQWRATNYTITFQMYIGAELAEILSQGVTHIAQVSVYHTTTAADERSTIYIPLTAKHIGAFESADTTDLHVFYGPYGPLKRFTTAQTSILTLVDEFAEWSGNCTTWVTAYGRTKPRQAATASVPAAPQEVNVVATKLWPWYKESR